MSDPSRLATLAAAILLAAPVTRAEVEIEGRLVGHDDAPMRKAHVQVVRPAEGGEVTVVEADPEGRFRLSFEAEGFVVVRLAGVDHEVIQLPLVLDGSDGRIQIEARLRTYHYADLDALETIPLVGDVNQWNRRRPERMRKDFGGVWYAEFEWDSTSAYQLLGVVPDRLVPGTEAIDYVYDGWGGYSSVAAAENGVLSVTFDPAQLVRSERERHIDIDPEHADVLQMEPIFSRMSLRRDRYFTARAQSRPGRNAEFEAIKAEIVAELPDLMAMARAEEDPELRKLRYVEAIQVGRLIEEPPDTTFLEECLTENPPSSPYWSPASEVIGYVVAHTGGYPDRTDYLLQIVNENPDPELRKLTLVRLSGYANKAGRMDEVGTYAKRLQEEFPGGPWDDYVPPPETDIAKGKPVPAFSVRSVEDSSRVITPETFAGKVVLIDFWATWCRPCVGEMPALHAVYDEYHDQGFEILSLSLDRQPALVTRFRAQWPMPWEHVFLTGGFENPVARTFEVTGIPKPVLVGPDGTIIAVGRELRGSNLKRTIKVAMDGAG